MRIMLKQERRTVSSMYVLVSVECSVDSDESFVDGLVVVTDQTCFTRRLPHLSERGSVVNIASVQGHIAVPNNGAYVASKHGVVGLTKTASEDHVANGIRVNAVCPGYWQTQSHMAVSTLILT